MTTKTLLRAIKVKKPVVVREKKGSRYVMLDWNFYKKWEEIREDIEDQARINIALRESRDKKKYTLEEVRKKYHLL